MNWCLYIGGWFFVWGLSNSVMGFGEDRFESGLVALNFIATTLVLCQGHKQVLSTFSNLLLRLKLQCSIPKE